MLVDFIPIQLVLSDVNVYDDLYKEKMEEMQVECTSIHEYHDESSQSTSDEVVA